MINIDGNVLYMKDVIPYSKYFICPKCFKYTRVWGQGQFDCSTATYTDLDEIGKNVKVKILNPNIQCYCDDCNEFMFECDRYMVNSIIKFNRSGFPTEFCCQGHHEDECESDIGGLCSIPYIRFVDTCESDWTVICNTLKLASLYYDWRVYFHMNHLEKFKSNLEKISLDEHPILVNNKDREIYLNSKIFDNLDISVQEFNQIRLYFCTVINQVAYILSDED